MDYKDNINYRHSLEQKVFVSDKLTDSEKWWCFSNPMFNERFDFPCYKRDVISIPENQETIITLNALSFADNINQYRPVISVVGEGTIKVEHNLFMPSGKKSKSKKTRIFVALLDVNRNSTSFSVISKSGLISIAYQCEYYDERMRLHKCEFSDGANLAYGMKRKNMKNNKVVYYCNNPTNCTDTFDSFVFSIEILR